MPAPTTAADFLELVRRSGLLDEARLESFLQKRQAANNLPEAPRPMADGMLADGLLTFYQANQLIQGKWRGFFIGGKYKILEHLGSGGMGHVYLCEHLTMRRRSAIKILPVEKARDSSYLERFYREARAVAALDHPNIVRAHDIDRDGNLHFIVMEYIDGSDLQKIVSSRGPLSPLRVAHYMSQSALGLQHAHEAGLVHRDLKPGNILVDRCGVVKILDLGLARFFHEDGLSKKHDETILGTADYLAPEQTRDSNVDIRADLYSLGATFYFCLTGRTLFSEGSPSQKLIWMQVRRPKPIRSYRPEVPEELANLIEEKLLAKDPAERFQTPAEVVEALKPWTRTPISPPPAEEMPQPCPALAALPAPGAAVGLPTTISGPGLNPALNSSPKWTRTPVPPRTPSPSRSQGKTPTPPTMIPPVTPRGRPAPETRMGTASAPTVPTTPSRAVQKAVPPPVAVREAPPPAAQEPEALPSPSLAAPPTIARRRSGSLWPWILAVSLLAFLLVAGVSLWLLTGRVPHRQAPATGETAPPAVVITSDEGFQRVKTAHYEALVAADGCLSSLRVEGVEFLRPGLGLSRGLYLHQASVGVLSLPQVKRTAANTLTASGPKGSIIYEFGADSFSCTAFNDTSEPMNYYAVLSKAVVAAQGGDGEWVPVPAVKAWKEVTWYAHGAKLTMTGASAIWMWETDSAQVFDRTLAPGERVRIEVRPGQISAAEGARVVEVMR